MVHGEKTLSHDDGVHKSLSNEDVDEVVVLRPAGNHLRDSKVVRIEAPAGRT